MTVAADWNEPSDLNRLVQLREVWWGQWRVVESLQKLEITNKTEAEDDEVSRQITAARRGAVATASMLADDRTGTLESVQIKLTIALKLGPPPADRPPEDDGETEEEVHAKLVVSALEDVKSLMKATRVGA